MSPEIWSSGSDLMVTWKEAVCSDPAESVPVTVTVVSWSSVEDPEMTPVAGSMENPLGSVPFVTAHVTFRSPALPETVWETGVVETVFPWEKMLCSLPLTMTL